MRRVLHLRVALIGVSVMALMLAIVALLTYQLIRVSGRQDLDRVLRQEFEDAGRGLAEQIQGAAGSDGVASAAELDLAVQRYLALHPGSDRHLTVVQIGSRRLGTRDGPPALEQLQLLGALPTGEPGTLMTVDSEAGPLRVLSAPLTAEEQRLGAITVAGPLSAIHAQAAGALVRIAVAGSAGLVVGGIVLLLAVRRALQPVRDLAAAARSVDLTGLEARVPSPPRHDDEVGLMAHEFNRMLERIGRAEQQRHALLSAVSHELRTPLAVAQGQLELLDGAGPPEAASTAETLTVVRRELDRLGRIVDDLTAVSRGELGGTTAREPVFAPDVLAALRHRLDGLGIHDIQLPAAPPPVVFTGDEDRVAQALLNLVVNARTHTPPSTPVRVDARTNDGHVVFDVVDQGPGIDPAVLPSVFEPFVTTRPRGPARASGLGLTVVKAVTEAQGGSVNLTSDRDGTTVSLTFALDQLV